MRRRECTAAYVTSPLRQRYKTCCGRKSEPLANTERASASIVSQVTSFFFFSVASKSLG